MIDKYKSACIEYSKASSEVKRLGRVIGEALSACYSAQLEAWQKDHPDSWMAPPHVEHLKLAYEMDQERIDFGYEKYFVHHEDDVEGYLQEQCPHCYAAHLAIQERKKARQLFGIAKRRVSFMGNEL